MDDPTTQQVKAFLQRGCHKSALLVALSAKLGKPAIALLMIATAGYTPVASSTVKAIAALI